MSGWPTTRRFPRSLAEAWPREHADPITIYRRPAHIRGALLAFFIAGWLAYLLALWADQGA